MLSTLYLLMMIYCMSVLNLTEASLWADGAVAVPACFQQRSIQVTNEIFTMTSYCQTSRGVTFSYYRFIYPCTMYTQSYTHLHPHSFLPLVLSVLFQRSSYSTYPFSCLSPMYPIFPSCNFILSFFNIILSHSLSSLLFFPFVTLSSWWKYSTSSKSPAFL